MDRMESHESLRQTPRRALPADWVSNSPENGAWIPCALVDQGIQLIAEDMVTENDIPTFVIGIVDGKRYTDRMWKNDNARMKTLFATNNRVFEIKITPKKDRPDTIDVEGVHGPTLNAINQLNQCNADAMRIIKLGRAMSLSLYQLIIDLIQGWDQMNEHKTIYFITTGDTHNKVLKFCKWLCIDRMCSKIVYYNTLDYTLVGRVDPSRRPNQNRTRKGLNLSAILIITLLLVVGLLLITGFFSSLSPFTEYLKTLPFVKTVLLSLLD